ncbi:CHAT domain-containing protein [Streptomyces bambusae]|uniref:CHAT domain-containing protein n=1 Tax=Streptomyces bambusae TaxID=1550616 RepID=UPI001CFF42F7|nr:CHAT domain-containing protein [Streptomyces bambusae]MCB5168451.1 CHAT domain-containing protein [Streptomyces bambusae]
MSGPSRDELLSGIRLRLHHYEQWKVPEDILDPDLAATCRRLLVLLGSPTADVEAVDAVAHVHWYRALLQPDPPASPDARQAGVLFAALLRVAPERLPDELRAAAERGRQVVLTPDEALAGAYQAVEAAVREADAERLVPWTEVLERSAADPDTDPVHRYSFAAALCVIHHTRYDLTGNPGSLDRAVSWGRSAEHSAPDADPRLAGNRLMLVHALVKRHERTGSESDLTEAIHHTRLSLDAVEAEEQDPQKQLKMLGDLLLRAHRLRPDAAAVAEAVDIRRRLHRRSPTAQTLGALRDALLHSPASDSELASVVLELLDLTPPGAPGERNRLLDAALLFAPSARRTPPPGFHQRLEERITAALHASPVAGQRAELRFILALVLVHRFVETGTERHLTEARELVRDLPEPVTDAGPLLAALAGLRVVLHAWAQTDGAGDGMADCADGLLARFELTGRPEHLDAALATLARLERCDLRGETRTRHLRSRSRALESRYRLRNDPADLAEAIALAETCVAELPGPDHTEAAVLLQHLARLLLLRHGRTDDPSDATRAVSCMRAALAHAAPGVRPKAVGGLARALLAAAPSAGDEHLAEAIGLLEEEVADRPASAATDHVHTLALALLLRHERTGSAQDVFRLVSLLERHRARSTAEGPDLLLQHARLLATRLLNRMAPGEADPTRSETSTAAAPPAPLPEDESGAAVQAAGLRCQLRYQETKDPADLERAIAHSRSAATDPSGRREALLCLACQLVLLSEAEQVGPDHRSAAAEEAVAVLRSLRPQPPGDHPVPDDLTIHLAHALAAHHRAAASTASRDEAATLFAELARDTAYTPNERVPWARRAGLLLAAAGAWPAAADLLELAVDLRLRAVAALAGIDDRQIELAEDAAVIGEAAACALELQDVERALAILERGRHPLMTTSDGTPADLSAVAADGPVVVLTVSRFRCDAILLTRTGPNVLPLPDVDVGTLAGWVAVTHLTPPGDSIGSASLGTRQQLQRATTDALADLWDKVTRPVLDALGLGEPPADRLPPRLWWIPTSRFTWLPLHAAGRHPAGPSVLDRCVSSYAPSLHALQRARRQDPARRSRSEGLLVVAMPETPGSPAPDLPEAGREAEHLRRRFPHARLLGTCTGSHGPATPATVLAGLNTHDVVHFACHTQDDRLFPLRTRLLVEPSPAGGEPVALTVADIAALRPDSGRLAFLSACSTARPSHTALTDEGLDLAAAFQYAGFPHVIATLWRVGDTQAADFTAHAYATLAPPPGALAPSLAPYAVHRATHALRAAHPTAPLSWAAHIHVGP